MATSGLEATLRRRWTIWASLVLVYIIGYFHRVAPAVIAEDLMKTFQTSGVLLGGLSSIYFYTYAFMQIPTGILADTLGPRITVTIGAVVMGLGAILFGLAPSILACYGGRFLVGMGVSVLMVNILRTCVEWFRPNEMAFVTGITTTVGGTGALLATTPLALLAGAFSWRVSFVIIGSISILLAWVCWWVVKDRPSDCGLPPLENGDHPMDVREERIPKIKVWHGLKTVIQNPYTWPPFFGFFAFYSTLMGFSGLWGIPFLTQIYGLSNQNAANYMMAVSLGLILGCPVTGRVSDKVLASRRIPFVFCLLFYAIIWGMLCFLGGGKPPLAFLYPICFFMGFFSSGFVLIVVCSKEVNPPNLAGIAMGTANMGGFLGGAIYQVMLGKILDLNWDQVIVDGVRIYPLHAYRVAFLVCFVTALMGIGAGLLVKETRCRNVYDLGRDF